MPEWKINNDDDNDIIIIIIIIIIIMIIIIIIYSAENKCKYCRMVDHSIWN